MSVSSYSATSISLTFVTFVQNVVPESQDLPRQPPLELCLGQTLECIKLMAKSGLGACAFTSLDGVLQG
jgi:hypothetical protein